MAVAPKCVLALLAAASLEGCAAALMPVENAPGLPYVPEKIETSSITRDHVRVHTSWAGSVPACSSDWPVAAMDAKGTSVVSAHDGRTFPFDVRLSRGDRINVSVIDGEEFNGDYVIGPDGKIGVPHMPRQLAASLTEEQLAARLSDALAENDLISKEAARVSVRIVKYAPLQINVGGAVWQPGFVTINELDKTAVLQVTGTTRVYGDTTINRNLTAALREVSGIRPDGDIRNVLVTRRGKTYRFDLSGAVTGHRLLDPALEDGDQVYVPSTGCFDPTLVRPSSVTPRGIRIYVSKIHIGPDARYDEKIPFGLRLLQGAIIASCVGGNLATEGRRQIVLVSVNPITRRTEVVQRSVEQLVRDQDRDEINPMLMPDDAIACYDSTVREAVGIAAAVGSIANSVSAVVNSQRLLSGEN